MIKLDSVNKKFNPGTINEVYSLREVSLEIREGEFVTVIGTNGSGKSTLLNAIAGSILPDSGNIIIAGNEVTHKRDFERAQYISRVFQNPFMGTAPDMSIAVSLLMAVIKEPKVLLLDEHTAALDPKSAAQVIQLTKIFIERGRLTTLMVTYSMQQALDLGTRVIMMHKGPIIDDIP